ncbi:MAG: phosphatase PAP2 family protein [Parafilimonas sp.]|nr:phosphatase PAP2 family protein [Parafilimonas sp.]
MFFNSPVYNRDTKILLWLSIVFFVVMLIAFCFTGFKVTHDSPLQFDDHVFACLLPAESTAMTRFMLTITFLGSRYFLFPCYTLLAVYYLFFRKKLWFAIAIGLTGFLGNQLLFYMQDVFHRHRPVDPLISYINSYGYPSGHAFASYVFAGLLSYLIWRRSFKIIWKIILLLIFFFIATVVAISRIYLHVHYATDILGGFYLSMIWLLLCLWILYFVDRMQY